MGGEGLRRALKLVIEYFNLKLHRHNSKLQGATIFTNIKINIIVSKRKSIIIYITPVEL